MARIPLEIGEWGKIKRIDTPHGPAARAYFRDGRGVRIPVQRRGDTGAAAERNLTTALKQLAKAVTGDGAITAESTFDDLAEYYFAELEDEGTKDGTITTYRSNYDRHIKPEIGEVKLRQLTVARLQQVIRVQKDKPSTAKGIRVILKNMCAVAVRHDAMRLNLANNTKPVVVKQAAVKALKPEQVKAMLALFEITSAVRQRDLNVPLKLLAVTGCRTGELLAIRWQDIDLDKGIVRITGTMVPDSKTKKMKRQDEGKSIAATRGMTLPASVVQLLRERYATSDVEPVFPARNGEYQWPNNFRRKWRAVTDKTAFEGVTPRDFRKAVATYLDSKVGAAGAQLQLGHESADVTTRYYIEQAEVVADFADHLEELVS